MKRIAVAAGNVALAAVRRRKSGGPGHAGACAPRAAGVAAALLLCACAPIAQPVEEEEALPVESFRDCPHCPEMMAVPAGEFMMGSPETEAGRDEDEGPLHRVTIPRPFAVGKYEVTNEEYAAFVRANPALRDPGTDGGDRHPVVGISWHEARAYAAWLSRETEHDYRLLSESEWEYAARAGTQTAYHWDDHIGAANAHCISCGTRWEGEGPLPVGSFFANGFDLHDMHGNVQEWVEDCVNSSGYEDAPSDGQAWLSGDCDLRVLRGGSWNDDPQHLRAASRGWDDVGLRDANDVGFRVARTN